MTRELKNDSPYLNFLCNPTILQNKHSSLNYQLPWPLQHSKGVSLCKSEITNLYSFTIMNKVNKVIASQVSSLKKLFKNLKLGFFSAFGSTNYCAAIDYRAKIKTNIEDSKTQLFKTIITVHLQAFSERFALIRTRNLGKGDACTDFILL